MRWSPASRTPLPSPLSRSAIPAWLPPRTADLPEASLRLNFTSIKQLFSAIAEKRLKLIRHVARETFSPYAWQFLDRP